MFKWCLQHVFLRIWLIQDRICFLCTIHALYLLNKIVTILLYSMYMYMVGLHRVSFQYSISLKHWVFTSLNFNDHQENASAPTSSLHTNMWVVAYITLLGCYIICNVDWFYIQIGGWFHVLYTIMMHCCIYTILLLSSVIPLRKKYNLNKEELSKYSPISHLSFLSN